MAQTDIMRNATQVVNLDIRKAIMHVEKVHGLTQWQQFKLMREVARGPGKVHPVEFFNLGLFRPSLTREQRAEFLVIESGAKLNASLNPIELMSYSQLMVDKFAMADFVRGKGFLAPETLALVDLRIGNSSKLGATTVLHNAAEIIEFLKACPVPIFGKPRYGSRSTGVFNMFDRRSEGQIGIMGNGREFSIPSLAEEILRNYPEGFLLQKVVRSIPEILAYADTALSTFRVTTIQSRKGAEVLYVCWRASGKGALADNFFYSDTAHCFVDHETCTVVRAQQGDQTYGGEVTVHGPTGLPLKGFEIPALRPALEAACELHNMFPEHGIIGWDVALTPQGPLFVEANHNPIHGTYQITADRGFMNEDFMPKIRDLQSLQAERISAQKATKVARSKSHWRNMLIGMKLTRS